MDVDTSPDSLADRIKKVQTSSADLDYRERAQYSETQDSTEERLSSQRQRIFKALITDDIIMNNSSDFDARFDGSAYCGDISLNNSGASCSSSSGKRLGEETSLENGAEHGKHRYEEEMSMRVQEHILDLKLDNADNNSDYLEEMDAAILSIRRWQEERSRRTSEIEGSLPLNDIHGAKYPVLSSPQQTSIFDLKLPSTVDLNGVIRTETDFSEPLTARTANEETIASLKTLISNKKVANVQESDELMKALDAQERRVQDAASKSLSTNQDDEVIARCRNVLLPEVRNFSNVHYVSFSSLLESLLYFFDAKRW